MTMKGLAEQTMSKDANIQTELTATMLDDLQKNDRRKVKDNNGHDYAELMTLVHDVKKTNNLQYMGSTDVKIKINSLNEFEIVHQDLNEEEKFDQKQMAVALEDNDNILADPMTKNRRVVETTNKAPDFTTTNITNDIRADLGLIVEYADQPLLPLYKACAPLTDIIHNISFYIQIALDGTSEQPPDGLTIDESASIRLYTMEWESPHKSLYEMLNYTLKTADRKDLRPYFKYLKLFLTALVKLPCVPQLTIWRGVTKDLSAEFPPGTSVTWWGFSSCTTALSVLENNMYLGTTGNRTLFSVEAINGRIIRGHSYFNTEEEILLLPGTHMVVLFI
ncbi:unnamed protein product [Adineta steineri]|uniref:NAD(P)(+)--arginine ADP-ribosyltransferase n=1 Tax=Adineta steineri TaxID=433720 RepID=A0A813YA27_9BILA|nr:unnamed protein product [Adineta steineri]CAF3542379.1 unnamed protein product [Adineta steineri]